VGLRAGLDAGARRKRIPFQGIEPRSSSPYTKYVIKYILKYPTIVSAVTTEKHLNIRRNFEVSRLISGLHINCVPPCARTRWSIEAGEC
jgi:hypothetical protein